MASPNSEASGFSHEKIETNNFLMIVLILIVVAVGGIVEIVPLYFQRSTTQPTEGLKPYPALQLAGRDSMVVGVFLCPYGLSRFSRYRQRNSRTTIPFLSVP